MANSPRHPLSPTGLEQAPVPRARRWPWVAAVVAAMLLTLAWFEGGEEPLRPIAEDVALPERGQ
ncbi:MAG: hypothetical protein O9293_11030 [Porphyrobacter sp.]|nr:hypothetical protein [Porphyrobacter sp.]